MNRNSALIWFPKILAAGLPVPRTVIIPYEHISLVCFLENGSGPGGKTYCQKIMKDVEDACHTIGFPCFLRTDLAAAKHDGESSYLIRAEGEVQSRVHATVIDNEMKFGFDELPQAFMVRQFLNLDSRFVAFGGFPVSREFRFFVDKNGLICYHPYWPKDAIQFYGKEIPDRWEEMLDELNEAPKELFMLADLAIAAARVNGGEAWSVDFARDKAGVWWLTDMAVAADSFHWESCPNRKMQVHRDLITGETWTKEKPHE